MPHTDLKWEALSPDQEQIPTSLTGTFTIKAPPKCDIWRPSPDHNVFDAPAIITRIKASSFKSMSVTVTAEWKTLYDQGGLLLAFPGKHDVREPKDCRSWIKAGIENEQGEAKLGVVGAHAYSDWSLCPLPDRSSSTATIKMTRNDTALWIYAVHDGKEIGLREVTWAFLEERGDADAEIWVGVYAAKPTPDHDDAGSKLDVTFSNLALDITAIEA